MLSLRVFPWLLILLGLTFACHSTADDPSMPEKKQFEWIDPSFSVAYPGPYTDPDSASILLATQALAMLADGHPEGFPFPLSDSVKVSLCDEPIEVLNEQGFQAYFKTWHGQHDEVRYEAFNIRSVFNEAFQTTVFFCFGRWQFQPKSGDFTDRYATILFSLDSSGSLTAVTEWALCWPENSPLEFHPNPDPSHFHNFAPAKLGSMEAAIRAVSTTQALFAVDVKKVQRYLADTVQFTPSCGLTTRWSKEKLSASIEANNPIVGVDPISVIPFYQERQQNHVVLVLDYENFVEEGRLYRYSYLRTYILDRNLQITNILVQRRVVSNAVNWPWQDVRKGNI